MRLHVTHFTGMNLLFSVELKRRFRLFGSRRDLGAVKRLLPCRVASAPSLVTPGGHRERRTSTCAAAGATLHAVSRRTTTTCSVSRAATAWLGRAMQWLRCSSPSVETSCGVVRQPRRSILQLTRGCAGQPEKAGCRRIARAARVVESRAPGVVLDVCHRLQTAGTTPLRCRRPTAAAARNAT